jgi:hypothetical protein
MKSTTMEVTRSTKLNIILQKRRFTYIWLVSWSEEVCCMARNKTRKDAALQ